MSDYFKVYNKRLQRHGSSADRLEKGRQANFERFLQSSPHHVYFGSDNQFEGVLEPESQSESRTVMHLLCRVNTNFHSGDVYEIAKDKYLFWYRSERKDSGYNRWVLLKITGQIEWQDKEGSAYICDGYLESSNDSSFRNQAKVLSKSASIFLEDNRNNMLIIPSQQVNIELDNYIIYRIEDLEAYFRVIGKDFISTPGLIYISVDPTEKRNLTPAPIIQEGEKEDDYFWLGGGQK